MADKADFQNKHLDVMLDPNLDIYSLEGKKDFVRSLVAYNIVLEGNLVLQFYQLKLSSAPTDDAA